MKPCAIDQCNCVVMPQLFRLLQALLWVLVLVACVAPLPSSGASSGDTPHTKLTHLLMRESRAAHTTSLLQNGHVLITGGFRVEDQHLASAEIFDPAKNSFALIGDMTMPRVGHVAVLLLDGRVVILGGWSGSRRVGNTEIYDPARGIFTAIAPMRYPRADFTATLLRDGRVVLLGGFSARNTPNTHIELFDSRTNTFNVIGTLPTPRSGHTATLLDDGTVLLAGGTGSSDSVLQSAELFDPATNTITPVGNLAAARRKHAAVRLSDGRVLVIGGSDRRDWNGKYNTTEVFDPKTQTFSPGPQLAAKRFKLVDAVATLRDGDVLVGGGSRTVERFDSTHARASFTHAGQLPDDYFAATATSLTDGGVLIAGGYNQFIVATDGAWVYR